jgi:hypothetical protein
LFKIWKNHFLFQENMGAKRKLKDGLNPPAKHRYSLRSKSKCNPFELENFCLRFPQLSENILGELDYKSLVKFREASKFWHEHIIEQRIYCIRQIEQCTETYTEFNEEWKIVVKKTPLKLLRLIEVATRTLKGNKISSIDLEIYGKPLKILKFYFI